MELQNTQVSVSYVVYDDTGYVIRKGFAPTIFDVSSQIVGPGESILVVPGLLDPTKGYYVKDQQLEETKVIKPWVSKTTVLANGVDTVMITDIPLGCTVSMFGSGIMVPPTVVPESEITLTLTAPGKVQVYIQKRPDYGQIVVEVDAV